MSNITVKIEKGTLIITAPIPKELVPSKSGKSLVIVSSHGNIVTDVLVQGKPLTIGLNAYIRK